MVENRSGEILAYAGSLDFLDEARLGQNDGVRTPRQPGSALKPFAYGLALASGWTPASLLSDVEVHLATPGGDWIPRNYDRRVHGPVRLRVGARLQLQRAGRAAGRGARPGADPGGAAGGRLLLADRGRRALRRRAGARQRHGHPAASWRAPTAGLALGGRFAPLVEVRRGPRRRRPRAGQCRRRPRHVRSSLADAVAAADRHPHRRRRAGARLRARQRPALAPSRSRPRPAPATPSSTTGPPASAAR